MKTDDNRLDELTQIVARGGGASHDEVERIASAPFFSARVRARIEVERNSREEERGGWLGTLLVAWRAVAVLLVITVATAAAYWVSRPPAARQIDARTNDDVSRVVAGGTCALSATDECAISREEVLATLFADEGGKTQK
ncbi:MAG TPA: hypothetical protein VN743_14795 [Blastocatellia bacterium]|nr:hypothetical protein [Blastocatellia bacterium]